MKILPTNGTLLDIVSSFVSSIVANCISPCVYTRVRPESCSYSFVHLTNRVFVFSHDTHLGHAVFLFLSRHPFFPTCHTPFFLYLTGMFFLLFLQSG